MSDIRRWLKDLDLEPYAEAFEAEQISPADIPNLTDDMLKELGLPMGPRSRVLADAKSMAPTGPVTENQPPIPTVAERRQLTVMFCDLVGSTALSRKLDPEELRSVIQAYQKAAGDVISRYEGHVAQYLGDGVMIYFGWPRAHEDDADRAVRAGLKIVEALNDLDTSVDLLIRIGIATGPVVVGDSSGDSRDDAKLAVGETPNMAARIQAVAEANTVLISDSTRRLIGGAFELDDLGRKRLRGVDEAVTIYCVIGEAAAESRFDAAIAGIGLTPLVGRDSEIALALERWQQAKDGEGQVVLLSGEPGIGKSRITQELRERLADQTRVRLRYQCSPYYTNSAFYPVITQLEHAAGFDRTDSTDHKLNKLETALALATDDIEVVAPLIASMMSLPVDRYPPLNLSPQKQKERTIAALVDQLDGLAKMGQILMIFEDAHWIDPTTLETLGPIIARVQKLPVLLVVTYRPEFDPPWSGHGHLTTITLNRLSRKQGASMVGRIADGKAFPNEVLDQIVAKTDGVPLFVEELTKTVLEAGFLKQTEDAYVLDGPLPPLAIPSSLQDSLMARLDRLSPVKEVAQIGACIGREFTYELLAAISPLGHNELQDALQQLVNSELIFSRGSVPVASYTFKHALVQDSAYESLLKSQRQQHHAKIVAVLAERFVDLAAGRPELIAHHQTRAGQYERAIPNWLTAGQMAFSKASYSEATQHLVTGLELTNELTDEGLRNQLELSLQCALGMVHALTGGYGSTEAEDAYSRAETLSVDLEDSKEAFGVRLGLGSYHWVKGNASRAFEYYDSVSKMAALKGNRTLGMVGHSVVGSLSFNMGNVARALDLLPKADALYEPGADPDMPATFGQDWGVHAIIWLYWARGYAGFIDQGRHDRDRAIMIADDLQYPFVRVHARSLGAIFAAMMHEPDEAEKLGRTAMQMGKDHGILYWAAWGQVSYGSGLRQLGRIDEAFENIWAGQDFLRAAGTFGGAYGWIYEELALAHIAQKDWERAEQALRQADEWVAASGEHLFQCSTKHIWGLFHVAKPSGDKALAERHFQEAIEIAQSQTTRLLELRATTSLARLWFHQGQPQKARNILAPVYGWFSEGRDTKDLKDAKALLDMLS